MSRISRSIGRSVRIAATCAVIAFGVSGSVRAQPPKVDPMELAPSEIELRKRLGPLLPSIRAALQSDNADAQRAALAIVADFPPGLAADANLAAPLTTFLQRDLKDPELIALGLRSYGRIDPDPAQIGKVVGRYSKSEHAIVRRAAAESLAAALQNSVPSERAVAKATKFIDVAKQALPLIGEALGDTDGATQRAALDGVATTAKVLTDLYVFDAPVEGDEAKPKDKNDRLAPLAPVLKELVNIVPKLAAPFTAPDVETRLAAARILDSMGALRRVVISAPGSGSSPFAEGWPALRPAVTARMKDPSPAVRLAVTEALESLGDALEARELLREGTTDRSPFVRWAAARALGRSAPAKADPTVYAPDVAAVARLVGDTDADVRTAALTALARFGTAAQSATPAVLGAVTRGDVEPRVAAVKALSALESPPETTVPVLILALGDRDLRLRRAAAAGLVRFGPAARGALPQLRTAVVDPDPELRLAAAEAILAIERTTRVKDL